MSREFTLAELEAFLDEGLTPPEMAEIEAQLRHDPELMRRLRSVHGRRDAGVHSLAAIWRRHRISCPDRELLGSYLLAVLDSDQADYIRFHLEQVGCRYCAANLRDLQSRHQEAASAAESRQRRFFQSSAGYLAR